jgi:hypothetical protein
MKDKRLAKVFQGEEAKLSVVYVDKLGNEWRQYDNIFHMKWKRAKEAKQAAAHADMCVNPEMLDSYLEKILNALINMPNEAGKKIAVKHLNNLQERRTWAAEETTLQKLANCYWILEGEDPAETSEYWFDKKKEIWKQDSDCYAFFLNSAFLIIRNVKDLSDTGMLEYLREKQVQSGLSVLKQPMQSGSETL